MTRDELAKVSHAELVERMLTAHAELEQVAQQVEKVEQQAERERERREQAERQLRWFKNQLFGAKSERRVGDAAAGQQLFLGEIEVDPDETVRGTAVRSHERRRRQPRDVPDEKGLRFDDSVPVETVVLPNPELDGVPEDELELVGEKVRHLLCQKPAAYVIQRIVRQTFKRKDTGKLTTAPPIAAVLEKSYADVSLLAGMLVDKFRYHLPLYRQHQRIQAAGITVSRASLTSWVGQAAWLLEPIYEAQRASVLASQVLAMDETPIRAGRSKAKAKMKTGFYWPIYGDRDEVIFPFAPSRAHRVTEALLGGFEGTLLSDGYPAYEAFAEKREKVVHARCWAHARRYFIRAEDVEPQRAAQALESIRTLYAHEQEIRKRGLDRRDTLAFRGEHSKPVADAFFAWLRDELQGAALLPSNPFTAAANYALEAKPGLEVFLADPDVPIDTNHLERALRVIPMGKKNWLFCWSELGAHQVGQVQSLLTTCVLHGVDPYTYLVDVLQRVDLQPQSRVHELTPRLWKDHFGDAPLGSWAD